MILVYTPCSDEKEANTIAKALLNDKLIACANTIPINIFRTLFSIISSPTVSQVRKLKLSNYKVLERPSAYFDKKSKDSILAKEVFELIASFRKAEKPCKIRNSAIQ